MLAAADLRAPLEEVAGLLGARPQYLLARHLACVIAKHRPSCHREPAGRVSLDVGIVRQPQRQFARLPPLDGVVADGPHRDVVLEVPLVRRGVHIHRVLRVDGVPVNEVGAARLLCFGARPGQTVIGEVVGGRATAEYQPAPAMDEHQANRAARGRVPPVERGVNPDVRELRRLCLAPRAADDVQSGHQGYCHSHHDLLPCSVSD